MRGGIMKLTFATACFVLCSSLAPVAFAVDSDTDRNKPATFVKDSAITTKVKTKLAAENPASIGTIHVDTDNSGVVWLSGTAKTQQDIDQAVSITKNTEGVKSVRNEMRVQR